MGSPPRRGRMRVHAGGLLGGPRGHRGLGPESEDSAFGYRPQGAQLRGRPCGAGHFMSFAGTSSRGPAWKSSEAVSPPCHRQVNRDPERGGD